MKFRILISSLSLLLFSLCSCSGNSSNNSESNSSKEGNVTIEKDSQSASTGIVNIPNIDKNKWIYGSETMPLGGVMETVGCYSENYFVIDGTNIALYYTFSAWPQAPQDMFTYTAAFSLAPINNSGPEIVPTFDVEANKRLYIKWNNGSVEKLNVGILKNNTNNIILINPTSYQFQKELNEQKKFSIGITTSEGKTYTYHFDVTKLGNLDI